MTLAQDLMGLGMPANLALQVAVGGSGPLTIIAAGSAFSSSTKILANQTMVACTTADSTKGIGLPTVGGDNGCLLADEFTVGNVNGTDCLKVFASSGVTICTGGSNTSSTALGVNTTMTLYPISTTLWIANKGA